MVVGNSALTGSVLDVLQRDGSKPMRLATLELWRKTCFIHVDTVHTFDMSWVFSCQLLDLK